MPDRKRKPERTTPHKDKLCKTCRRAIRWQKRWEQDWDIIKFCSEACSGYRSGEKDAALEAAILDLLAERGADGDKGKTICPSEAAKLVGGSARGRGKARGRDSASGKGEARGRDSASGKGEARGKDRPSRRDWEALMEPARAVARRLAVAGRIDITQHGEVVDPSTAKGPIRLRLR